MMTFLATVHILACLGLITLVMLQDSKGGGMFAAQSSSTSVLGATGATSLAGTLTKIIAIILAITCVGLAMMSSRSDKSVIDAGNSAPITNPQQPMTPTQPVNGATATPVETAPATTAPATAAPAAQPNK